jgi:ribosomal RNA-processing protein 17
MSHSLCRFSDSDGDEEWTGINDGSEKHEQEQYENEEHLATVTIVEDFDPDTIIHGSRTIAPRTTTNANSTLQYDDRKASKPIQKLGIPHKTKSKPRTKVHYETKDARKLERTKQRARRTEKADLAGGKVKAKGAARRKKAAKGKGRH